MFRLRTLQSSLPDHINESLPWKLLTLCSIALYGVLALLMIVQRPGLQYDESLLVLGAVHMRHSSQELTLPHDPDTWICVSGRCLPLMTVRYVGALKEYLCLPFFMAFGPRPEVIRGVSALLGAFGLWGFSRLITQIAGASVSAIVTLLIAINPSYIDFTVFDNGAIAAWMAAMGGLSLALARYLDKPRRWNAAWVGAALGLGVWARANFAWLAIALFAAWLIVFRRRALNSRSHWLAMLLGGVVTSLPFLVYQVISAGGTLQATAMFEVQQPWSQLLYARLVNFAEMLISNREHRAIWDGPGMPGWQRWLFSIVALASCVVCLAARGSQAVWARIASLTALILGCFLFFSRLPVAEHHFIVLLPLVALVTVMASIMLVKWSLRAAVPVAGVALIYVLSVTFWNVSAIDGLKKTGGTGQWSNAIYELDRVLQTSYTDREILVLDWGLQNNLYVLSDGRIRSREVFDAAEQSDAIGQFWLNTVARGGLFLINGPTNRHFNQPTAAFLKAVDDSRPTLRRYPVRQKNGKVFAEIFDIAPSSGVMQSRSDRDRQRVSTITTAEERYADRLDGFHHIEQNGWRWTKKRFAVQLDSPPETTSPRLTMTFYIPAVSVERLGPVTLAARINQCTLLPATYSNSGTFTFLREIKGDCLRSDTNHIALFLDKALPASPSDSRELGIVVQNVSLESQ